MATFNGMTYLPPLVNELVRQSELGDHELLFVDDASTDGTAEYLARVCSGSAPATLIRAPRRRGKAVNVNVIANDVDSQNLVFVDQDDRISDDYLDSMARALTDHSFVSSFVDIDTLNCELTANSLRDLPDLNRCSLRLRTPTLWEVPVALGGSIGLKTELWRDVGGFDPEVGACADVDWCIRARQAGHQLYRTTDATLYYRLRSSLAGLVRQRVYYGRSWRALHRKYRDSGLEHEPVLRATHLALSSMLNRDRAVRRGGLARAAFLLGRGLGPRRHR